MLFVEIDAVAENELNGMLRITFDGISSYMLCFSSRPSDRHPSIVVTSLDSMSSPP